MTESQTIYVRLLDGADVLIPVCADQLSQYRCRILDDEAFETDDPSVLFEYYPGDIVESVETLDEECGLKAVKLLELGTYPNRKYLLFKFKATLHQLPITKETALEFGDEIARIQAETSKGVFAYRGIKETILFLIKLALPE